MLEVNPKYRVALIIKNTKIKTEDAERFWKWFEALPQQLTNPIRSLSEFDIFRKLELINHPGNIFCNSDIQKPRFLKDYQTRI